MTGAQVAAKKAKTGGSKKQVARGHLLLENFSGAGFAKVSYQKWVCLSGDSSPASMRNCPIKICGQKMPIG